MLQSAAWQISLSGIALVTAAYLFVYLRSGDPAEFGPVKRRMYRIRTAWFVVLLAISAVAAAITLPGMPYGATHGTPADTPPVTIDVRGHQWYWEMDRNRVPAGREVAFRVTAADVNHGFAIYAPDETIVAQTQAMPGHVNVLEHTFSEPGTYTIRCLEYCGIAHHVMTTRLEVVAGG